MNKVPLKYLVEVNPEVLSENTAPAFEFEYVDIGCVDRHRGIVQTKRLLFEEAPSRARRVIRVGDVLVSTVRTYLRAVASVGSDLDQQVCSTGFAVLRPTPQYFNGYLYYVANSFDFIEQVVARSTGVSYPAINADDLVRIPVPYPSMERQCGIAEFLDQECAKLEGLRTEIVQAIALSREWMSTHAAEALEIEPSAPVPLGRYATLQRGFDLPENSRRGGDVEVIGSGGPVGAHDTPACKGPCVITGRYGSIGHVTWNEKPCWPLNTTLFVTNFKESNPRFIYWALRALPLKQEAAKAAVPGLHRADVHRLRLGRFDLEQQGELASNLDAHATKLGEVEKVLDEQHAHLIEYRDALIAEAVMGRLDLAHLTDSQMEESLAAVREGEKPEVLT